MSYDEIRKSALNIFSEKGFHGTTIKDIASGAGLKPSSIYSHITSKEELFIETWNECDRKLKSSVKNLFVDIEENEDYDAEKVLYEYYSTIIRYFMNNQKEYLFLKQATFLTKNKNIVDRINIVTFLTDNINIEYFGTFFRKLQKENVIIQGDYREITFAFISLILSYLEQAITYKIKLSEGYIDKYWSIFLKGIKE